MDLGQDSRKKVLEGEDGPGSGSQRGLVSLFLGLIVASAVQHHVGVQVIRSPYNWYGRLKMSAST